MAKRRPNVSPYSVISDFENDSDLEELSCAKRRKSSESLVSSTVAYGMKSGMETVELTEENEHTYSCSPIILTNPRGKQATDNSVSTSNKNSGKWKSILRNSSSTETVQTSVVDSSSASEQDDDEDFTIDPRPQKSRRSKAKCFSKNAINARLNRIRKKQYVSSLEDDVKSLKIIKKALSQELNSKSTEIASLKNEVKYLRSIIANNGQIGGLLKRICTNNSIEIRSSVVQQNNSQCLTFNKACESDANNVLGLPFLTNNSDFPKSIDTDFETNALLESNLDVLLGSTWSSSATPALDLPENDEFFRCETPSKYLDSFGDNQSDYGVCLHVGRNRISLEFCAACNESALNNWSSNMFD